MSKLSNFCFLNIEYNSLDDFLCLKCCFVFFGSSAINIWNLVDPTFLILCVARLKSYIYFSNVENNSYDWFFLCVKFVFMFLGSSVLNIWNLDDSIFLILCVSRLKSHTYFSKMFECSIFEILLMQIFDFVCSALEITYILLKMS